MSRRPTPLLPNLLCQAPQGPPVAQSESCSVVSDSLQPRGLYSSWNSPGQNTGVGSLSLPQGIFPTQGSNPGLAHCGRLLYQLSHKGSPRILDWVGLSLLLGIFLTQESNQGFLCCRRTPPLSSSLGLGRGEEKASNFTFVFSYILRVCICFTRETGK